MMPDDWFDDGRPTAAHIAEAREITVRRCSWRRVTIELTGRAAVVFLGCYATAVAAVIYLLWRTS